MKLELRKIKVEDIVLAKENSFSAGTLTIDEDWLVKELSKIHNVKSVKLALAKPGERKRIIPVKDVIEPRYRVGRKVSYFAAVTGETAQLGEGCVNVFDGAAVVTIGDIVGFQEGVIDMWGEGAKWTPFSKTNNIVVDITVVEGLDPHEHEYTVREVGLKSAELIGSISKDVEDFGEVKVYETGNVFEETAKYPDLPKVVYVEMLISQGLLHDDYIYGVNSAQILPTLIHPNEEIDGAVVSGNCVAACDKITTYQHQNNAIVLDLYDRHGKDINFLGVVLTPELTTLTGKFRTCDFTAKLCKMLGADGVIVSEEGYGNPDSDLLMICERLEESGIKTVLVTDECAGWEGDSQPLADTSEKAVAVVSTGNVSHVVKLEKADEIIGNPNALENLAGGWAGAYNKEDGTMIMELNAVIGSTSEIGYHNATIVEK